jgi:catechol 2,3-dioxygenase-like lactoylglutathione lyase family enzyme
MSAPGERPAPPVEGIIETSVYVTDLERAAAFYERVLGLERVGKEEGRHVFLRAGRGMLLLFRAEETAKPGGEIPPHGAEGPVHFALAVAPEEYGAWREQLDRHGVAIEREKGWGDEGMRSLFFRDPDGSLVELITARTWGL